MSLLPAIGTEFTPTPKKAELFTGIVQGKGDVLLLQQFNGGLKLRIQMNELSTGWSWVRVLRCLVCVLQL